MMKAVHMSFAAEDETQALRGDILVSIGLPDHVALALAGSRQVIVLALSDITTERMVPLQNTMMACELIAAKGDALGVIAALNAAGAIGSLTVLSPRLPDPGMVERELRAAADSVKITLVSI
jgi:hypothetical protein